MINCRPILKMELWNAFPIFSNITFGRTLYTLLVIIMQFRLKSSNFSVGIRYLLIFFYYKISTHVGSRTKELLFSHGTRAMPSCCLPSSRSRPSGSRTARTLTLVKARLMILLRLAWRRILPAALVPDNPRQPSCSTAVPHWH